MRPPLWMPVVTLAGTAVCAQAAGNTIHDPRSQMWMVALGFVSVLLAWLNTLAWRADLKRATKAYLDATAVRDREAHSYRLMVEAARTQPCPTTAPMVLPPTQRMAVRG
jgi:hypothetical protein